ncbi:uncharacterized protein [Temnothorax longispinosus]|uniref:uncharacterized protein n=1 Tax=Temnothorax longispinosus TaxID=300112 RepID=UPI003A9A643F
MSVPMFVDLQGFLVGMKFVVKEVLRKGCVPTHHIFTYPMPWNLLTKSDKSCATWLIRNHHGLRWEDGNVPYSMVKRLITSAVLAFRCAVRILSRRYALTATGYKFLEIGINVGPPSYVEIAIGDHRGKELLLSLETWKALYEQRRNIQNFFRNDFKDAHSFINVGPLTVRVCTSVNNVKLIRLESVNVRLMMTESTLHRMFDLDRCIEARFDRLVRILAAVDAKFAQFSDIASTVTDPREASNAIYASDAFNTNQLIDCELAALVF